jgi:hypothetical protein
MWVEVDVYLALVRLWVCSLAPEKKKERKKRKEMKTEIKKYYRDSEWQILKQVKRLQIEIMSPWRRKPKQGCKTNTRNCWRKISWDKQKFETTYSKG